MVQWNPGNPWASSQWRRLAKNGEEEDEGEWEQVGTKPFWHSNECEFQRNIDSSALSWGHLFYPWLQPNLCSTFLNPFFFNFLQLISTSSFLNCPQCMQVITGLLLPYHLNRILVMLQWSQGITRIRSPCVILSRRGWERDESFNQNVSWNRVYVGKFIERSDRSCYAWCCIKFLIEIISK